MLRSDGDISHSLAQYHHERARAVILINNANNYTLTLSLPEVHIPVLVMTSQEGHKLLSILSMYAHPGDVLARIRPNDSESLGELSCSTVHMGMTSKLLL